MDHSKVFIIFVDYHSFFLFIVFFINKHYIKLNSTINNILNNIVYYIQNFEHIFYSNFIENQ